MNKITENALLFRVNQLNETMKLFELTQAEMDNNAKIAQKVAAEKAATPPAKPTNDQPPAGVHVKPYTPPAAPPAGKWPTTHDEIVAFQAANKDQFGKPLATDGKIGAQTMQALARAGIQPPAGFQMVGNKQPAAQHPTQQHAQHPTQHQGTTAKPAAQPAAAPDPKVVAIQQDLISKGWPLKPTGIMDQNTSDAYEAQFKTDSMNNSLNQSVATNRQTEPAPNLNNPTAQPFNNVLSPTTTAQAYDKVLPTSPDAYAPKTDYLNNPPASLTTPVKESVSFSTEDSLARILQLAKW